MNWLTADYVILSVSVVAGVLGLFIGFSGTLAFLAATVLGSFAGRLAWVLSADYLQTGWTRGIATVILALLAFGFVRWAVRRVVNGLLRQPADSVFGFLVAAISGIVLSTLAVYLLNFLEIAEVESVFVREAMNFV